MNKELTFRMAKAGDGKLILEFTHKLAEFLKSEHEVEATEELFEKWMFDKKTAEAFFPVVDGKEVGFTLFATSFSSFLSKPVFYLGDIYVEPEYRNLNVGKKCLQELSRIASERGYGRIEWSCLDWNESAIQFYHNLGAEPMSDSTTYHLGEELFKELANDE